MLDAMPPGQDFSAHPARAFENLDQDEGTLEERRARVRKEAVVGEGGTLTPEEEEEMRAVVENPGFSTMGELRIPTAGRAREWPVTSMELPLPEEGIPGGAYPPQAKRRLGFGQGYASNLAPWWPLPHPGPALTHQPPLTGLDPSFVSSWMMNFSQSLLRPRVLPPW